MCQITTICRLLAHLVLASLVLCQNDDCADELLLRLKGSAYASQNSLPGRYTKAGTSGGKPYWSNGKWALWSFKGRWRFGPKNKIGTTWTNIISLSTHPCPDKASWKYWSRGWKIAGSDAKVLKHSDSKCSKEVMVRLLDMVAIKQESLAGKYTKVGTSGGKPYWVKGNRAIWASKGRWRIGSKNRVGTTWTNILSIGTSLCPEDIGRWQYWSKGWKNADEDSIVLPYLADTMVVVGGEGYGGRSGQVLGEPGCQLPQLPVDTIGNGLAIRGSKLITCGSTGCGGKEPCREMCYSLDNSRKFWNPDSKFAVTDHQQALYQISSIMDDDELGPKTVAMENGVYIISMPSPLESFFETTIPFEGGDEKGQRSTTELYYLKEDTIRAGGNLKNGRSGHNLVSVESGEGKPNKIYAVGGQSADIEVWNHSTKAWDSTDLHLNKLRKGFGALAVPKFMVCGE